MLDKQMVSETLETLYDADCWKTRDQVSNEFTKLGYDPNHYTDKGLNILGVTCLRYVASQIRYKDPSADFATWLESYIPNCKPADVMLLIEQVMAG